MNNYSKSELKEKFNNFTLPGNRVTASKLELLNYLDQLVL